MHDGPAAFSFELAGALSAEHAAELEQAWRTASSMIGERILIVDLSFVTRVDQTGRELLRHWHENGAQLVANSPGARLLAESIIGAPLPLAAADHALTYEPFLKQLSMRAVIFFMVVSLTLLLPATAAAAAMPEYSQMLTPRHRMLTPTNRAPLDPFTSNTNLLAAEMH